MKGFPKFPVFLDEGRQVGRLGIVYEGIGVISGNLIFRLDIVFIGGRGKRIGLNVLGFDISNGVHIVIPYFSRIHLINIFICVDKDIIRN